MSNFKCLTQGWFCKMKLTLEINNKNSNTSMKNKVSVLHVPVTTLWGNVPVNSKTANDPLQWGGPHFGSNFPLYGAKLQWHAWGMPREGGVWIGLFWNWLVHKKKTQNVIPGITIWNLNLYWICRSVILLQITNESLKKQKTKKRVQNWKCLGFCATRQF